eukprot:1003666_1
MSRKQSKCFPSLSLFIALLLLLVALLTVSSFTTKLKYIIIKHHDQSPSINHKLSNINQSPITDTQQVVDKYIDLLSRQSYDTFNEEITIQNTNQTFQRFSMEFINTTYHQIKLLIIGDSVTCSLFNFLLTQIHNHKLSKSPTYNFPSTHTVNLQLKEFRHKLSYPMRLNHDQFENIFNPQVNQRQNVFQARQSRYWITWNESVNWWNYENLYYWWDHWPNISHLNDSNTVWKYAVDNIVHNFGGLHQLHLHPSRKYDVEGIHRILTMETYMEDTIDKAAANHNIKCFIIRNTNPVCQDKFTGPYAATIQRYYAMQNLTTSQIKNLPNFQDCIKAYHLSVDKIYANYSYRDHGMTSRHNNIIDGMDLCSIKYTLSNFGANALNQRMATFVRQKQIKMTNNNVTMKLFYLDGNKLLQHRCQYTAERDGRHYHQIVPVQVLALFNIINSFCL